MSLLSEPVKGKVVEYFLLEKIRKSILSIQPLTIKIPIVRSQKTTMELFTIKAVVDFGGQGGLCGGLPNRDECTMFVPSSQIYPNVDFFIWKPITKDRQYELHAFQVTIGDVKDHLDTRRKFLQLESDGVSLHRFLAEEKGISVLNQLPKKKPPKDQCICQIYYPLCDVREVCSQRQERVSVVFG